jgi:hypothetical protein
MRNLFRRASSLFWQYPILWLPIVIADPLVLGLNLLDHKVTHAIILSLVTNHSVLGNAPEPIAATSFQTLKILLLTKPIDWGTHLIALCLYGCAMMAIFTLLSALRLRQQLSIGEVLYSLQKFFSRLMFFSLRLLIAIGIAAIPFTLLAIVFFQRNGARFVSTGTFSIALSAIFFSAIGYLAAPAALKLLHPQNSETLTPETTCHENLRGARYYWLNRDLLSCESDQTFLHLENDTLDRCTHLSGRGITHQRHTVHSSFHCFVPARH